MLKYIVKNNKFSSIFYEIMIKITLNPSRHIPIRYALSISTLADLVFLSHASIFIVGA